MTFRFGKPSTGGIVKAGVRPWELGIGFRPSLGYTNTTTGDGVTVVRWNLIAAARSIRRTRNIQMIRRLATEGQRMHEAADAISTEIFAEFDRRFPGILSLTAEKTKADDKPLSREDIKQPGGC